MEEELKKALEEYTPDLPSYNAGGWYIPPTSNQDLRDAFIAGAEWMAKQGKIIDGNIEVAGKFRWIDLDDSTLREQLMSFKDGDEVIVQIRKK